MRCPFCGSSLENNAKYCNDCGTAVDSECKGKNVNYRSYTVGRPEQPALKTPAKFRPEKNREDYINTTQVKPVRQNIPYVNNVPAGQYGNYTPNLQGAKPAFKKGGCAAVLIFVVLFFSFVITVGIIFGEDDQTGADEIRNDIVATSEYMDFDEVDFVDDVMKGRFDGTYYLNDWVNFAFKVPEGYVIDEDYSDFSNEQLQAEMLFYGDDGYFYTSFYEGMDASEFIENYRDNAIADETDEGLEVKKSQIREVAVGNTSFFTFNASTQDGDESEYVDVYATGVDGDIFYIVIDTSSPEINSQIINSFDEAHTDF